MTETSKLTDSSIRARGAALVLLAACVLIGQDVRPVGPEGVDIPVEVMANPPDEQGLWRASEAWLTMDFQMTHGYVRVTNTSGVTFHGARFYAEYYDDAGRLCFTLPFGQDSSGGETRGPFRPGETRTLMEGAQLAPAVRPRKVRLWFLGEGGGSEWPHPGITAPVTIRNGTWGTVEGIRLPKDSDHPLVPIALVDATSDSRGMPTSVTVVAAKDDASRQWARDLLSKLRFAPATRGGEPIGARTLILIRAFYLHPPRAMPAAPAFEDPWVRLFRDVKDDKAAFPFVNLLHVWSEEGSDIFRYFDVGTDWGLSVFRWSWDPVRGDTRREWLPPGGY